MKGNIARKLALKLLIDHLVKGKGRPHSFNIAKKVCVSSYIKTTTFSQYKIRPK